MGHKTYHKIFCEIDNYTCPTFLFIYFLKQTDNEFY